MAVLWPCGPEPSLSLLPFFLLLLRQAAAAMEAGGSRRRGGPAPFSSGTGEERHSRHVAAVLPFSSLFSVQHATAASHGSRRKAAAPPPVPSPVCALACARSRRRRAASRWCSRARARAWRQSEAAERRQAGELRPDPFISRGVVDSRRWCAQVGSPPPLFLARVRDSRFLLTFSIRDRCTFSDSFDWQTNPSFPHSIYSLNLALDTIVIF